ncbi:hypothetical protein D9M68_885480 [compost metagenome]
MVSFIESEPVTLAKRGQRIARTGWPDRNKPMIHGHCEIARITADIKGSSQSGRNEISGFDTERAIWIGLYVEKRHTCKQLDMTGIGIERQANGAIRAKGYFAAI